MPKKIINKNYYNHDDRSNNIRKVSFKSGSGRIRKNNRVDQFLFRYVGDDDVDMDGNERQHSWKLKQKNFKRRPGSPAVRGPHAVQPLTPNSDWYQVRILFGSKYGKMCITQLLLKHIAPKVFVPNSFTISGKDASFYVDDYDIALSLRNSNRKIQFNDGFLMEIRVRESLPPAVHVDDKVKEQIKLIMAKRYIVENKALDLTKFATDPGFQGELYCPLSRLQIMKAVCKIISENISDIVALNLSDNKITHFDDTLSVELKKLKNLKILHLAKNKIKSVHVLNCFRQCGITELVLKENPLVEMFKDTTHYVRISKAKKFCIGHWSIPKNSFSNTPRLVYLNKYFTARGDMSHMRNVPRMEQSVSAAEQILGWFRSEFFKGKFISLRAEVLRKSRRKKIFGIDNPELLSEFQRRDGALERNSNSLGLFHSDVRKKFPKLTKLDDMELPAVISFDVTDEARLPTPEAAFMCNPEGRGIVKAFLTQYFALYDSNNRLELAQAYHDNSSFSLSAYYSPNQKPGISKLNTYMQDNRNLLKVLDYPRRKSKLRTGKQAVVQFLAQLPKTQHDLSSFVVDLPLFTPALLNLSVNGVFREPNTSTVASLWPVRHFCRTFLIVPVNQGFCIINDLLAVTNATESEVENSFKQETQNSTVLQSPTPQSAPGGISAVVSGIQSIHLDESVKLQMVQTLATRTGMNLDWSKKCLDETEWDFDRAIWTFTELQSKGSIPAEAFVK